jgi:hypothetical protein
MIRCASCDTEYQEPLGQCPECGDSPGDEAVRCSRCGEEYVGGDSCPSCGLLHTGAACENHADRAAVGRCVLCGRAACEECANREKNVVLCEQHRTVPIIQGWAQVYSTTSEVEAGLLRENLRAEGIDAQVYSQKDMMFNVDLGELSIVRLLVPVWEYDQGIRVIRDHMDALGEVAFACSVCGEPFEPGARECSACGASLV